MPSLADFLKKLEANALDALNEYRFRVDPGLDQALHEQGVKDGFQVDVALEERGETNFLIRVATPQDTTQNTLRIWYLPWRSWNQEANVAGVSMTTLDGKGSGIFLTSQLDACRFTIQDETGNMTKVSVLHLAGTYGSGIGGAKAREKVQQDTLLGLPKVGLRRTYSYGEYPKNPETNKLPTDGKRSYYDGGMATVLGVRDKTGKWAFYGQRYSKEAVFDKATPI